MFCPRLALVCQDMADKDKKRYEKEQAAYKGTSSGISKPASKPSKTATKDEDEDEEEEEEDERAAGAQAKRDVRGNSAAARLERADVAAKRAANPDAIFYRI